MNRLLRILFRCRHARTTFPFTPPRKHTSASRTYIVCLDCGKEFDYDWQEMRVVRPRKERAPEPRKATA